VSSMLRRKRAEVAGSVGAGILGVGLGALLAPAVRPASVLILVAGASMHTWGMWTMRRLDRDPELRASWWVNALYWACWTLLAGLGASLAIRRT
jgi:hypothetical protein